MPLAKKRVLRVFPPLSTFLRPGDNRNQEEFHTGAVGIRGCTGRKLWFARGLAWTPSYPADTSGGSTGGETGGPV